MLSRIVAVTLAAALSLAGPLVSAADALRVSAIPDENPAELYVPVPLQADEFVNLESKEVLRMENGRIRVQLPAGGSALLVPVRR